MSYGIMRIQKIKSFLALAEREKHNCRTKTVLGADGSKNITIEGKRGLVKYVKVLEEQINKKNKRKTRRDAIRTIEVLFTSDKAFFKKVDAEQYFTECKTWLEEVFGKDNLLMSAAHYDEQTPHMHCILTCVKDGKFNYSGYVNGRRDLRNLQDSFYDKVEHLGLKRGEKVEHTKATYTHTKDWYKNIAKRRTYAEALGKDAQFDYAVQGIVSREHIDKLDSKNKELREELNSIRNKYNYLREGIQQAIPDVSIKSLEKEGKMAIEINEIAEEMGLY